MPNNRKRIPAARQAPAPSAVDSGIMVCMALVVAAVVVALHVQFGLSLGLAGVAGLSLFSGLVALQAWRRSEAERAALAEELHWLEAEIGVRPPAAHPRVHPGAAPPARAPIPGRAAPVAPAFGAPGHRPVDEGVAGDFHPPESAGLEETPAAEDSAADIPQFEVYRGAPVVPPGESLTDYWSSPEMLGGGHAEPAAVPEPAIVPAAPSAVREDDVEMLQRRIKDMLYQVTVAEQARELAATAPAVETAAPSEASVEASIQALEAAVEAMRQPSAEAVVPPVYAPQPAEAADPQVQAVREAIAAGRVDVYLEPILGLGDQAMQHYEVSIKLRGADGADLGGGEGDVLPGRGLLPLFDAERIGRSAAVAERLQARGKGGSVFSRASGEALIEADFTRGLQLDFVARPATARQLILTFSQADIRSFRASEQRAVSALSALGFRFAISALTDLDMNFAAMAQAGFGFVKIDAAVLINGLPHPGGVIPPGDVCRFLADQGFGLIVDGIDSEDMLARVFGFGVLMGQGTLFGGRRPVKANAPPAGGQAAA